MIHAIGAEMMFCSLQCSGNGPAWFSWLEVRPGGDRRVPSLPKPCPTLCSLALLLRMSACIDRAIITASWARCAAKRTFSRCSARKDSRAGVWLSMNFCGGCDEACESRAGRGSASAAWSEDLGGSSAKCTLRLDDMVWKNCCSHGQAFVW